MNPQIPYNYPLPFDGIEPQKMTAVEPELRFDSPEEWWNVPRANFPGETLPQKSSGSEEPIRDSKGLFDEESLPKHEYYHNTTATAQGGRAQGGRAQRAGVLLLSLAIISLLLIR